MKKRPKIGEKPAKFQHHPLVSERTQMHRASAAEVAERKEIYRGKKEMLKNPKPVKTRSLML